MSGRKNVNVPFTVLNAQSLATSFQSIPTNIQYQDRVGISITTTGTPTGTLTIEGSIDAITWFTLTFDTAIAPLSGTPNDYFFDIEATALVWIRIAYAATSGSGTMTAKISTKES